MSRNLKPIIIFGSAEMALLARYYFENDTTRKIAGHTVDDEFVNCTEVNGLPLVPFSEISKKFPPDGFDMFIALSYTKLNQLREEKFIQAKNAGYNLPTYICSKSVSWPDLRVGENCFILENQTIQPNVTIGDNVMIWSGNHIGHGSKIKSHTYIASHAVISGNCSIGKRCFLGVNSSIKDFTVINDDCFIAMDASVTQNMPNGSIAIGSGANIFESGDRRARVIRKRYFNI
jgi:sugar O-acyltransferase (sialic acid O-acetyltransferase NeuD family)